MRNQMLRLTILRQPDQEPREQVPEVEEVKAAKAQALKVFPENQSGHPALSWDGTAPEVFLDSPTAEMFFPLDGVAHKNSR